MFRNPIMARFLLACGAIPVYRKQDDPDKMDKNLDTFSACFAAFARGRLVAIYPEGTTHAEVRVQRIKTGAARIALGYEDGHPGELRMIPALLRGAWRFAAARWWRSADPACRHLHAYRETGEGGRCATRDLQWRWKRRSSIERIDDQRLVHAVESR
jgi:hypothetical protein